MFKETNCNRFVDGTDWEFNCEECGYKDDGFQPYPCGQQNCWHGCTVCEYNNMEKVCEEK